MVTMRSLITYKARVIERRRVVGDLVEVTCDARLQFVPGQYIRVTLDGVDDNRHCFNLISLPEEYVRFAFIDTNSIFKRHLIKASEVTIKGPYGRFVLSDDGSHVFIALGIGITPFLSMLRYAKKYNLRCSIQLLYIPYKDAYVRELRMLEERSSNFRFVSTDIRDLYRLEGESWYISGPYNLVSNVKSMVLRMGIKKVYTEEFTGY